MISFAALPFLTRSVAEDRIPYRLADAGHDELREGGSRK